MKTKTCDGCGKEGKLWKAKTKTQLGLCKSCAMKNATPIGSYKMTTKTVVETMVDEINEFNTATIKANNKQYKSIPELIKLATIAFNKAVKEKQSVNGKAKCMACNNWFDKSETDASHLYSAGKYPSVRFNENNVHLCCIKCNRYLEGNLEPYRKNLEDKIGHVAMVELKEKAMVNDFKWEREELLDIIKKYKL